MTSLNPVLTVGFQLRGAVQRHQNVARAEADRICLEALKQVRLSEPGRRLLQYPHELSGGMRQRLMIAMAPACLPNLLIADEPTTALDVTVQAEILALLKTIQRDTGMAMLFISHDMGVVEKVADRIAVMYQGELIEIGPRDAMLRTPAHAYTKRLLDAVPIALPDQRRDRELTAREIASPIRPVGATPVPFIMDEVAPGHFLRRSLDA